MPLGVVVYETDTVLLKPPERTTVITALVALSDAAYPPGEPKAINPDPRFSPPMSRTK